MGTLFLEQIKKQASSFLHEKLYKTARLVLSAVTEAELLAEEATNNDPCSPDAKTMTEITQASFDIDDYWRIADVLHRRFDSIDLKQWRQYYKSMVLLEFLLTHGPEEFAEEFRRDYRTIQELGTFHHTDENGFDWGKNMRTRSERIVELLSGGERLKQARLKALKITKEIQGFGSSTSSPSSSSPSSKMSNTSTTSGLNSTSSSPSRLELGAKTKHDHIQYASARKGVAAGSMSSIGETESEEFSTPTGDLWNFHERRCRGWEGDHPPPVEESGCLLDSQSEDGDGKEEEATTYGFISGICSKFGGKSPSKFIKGEKVAFRSLSDVGNLRRKKANRQFSKEY